LEVEMLTRYYPAIVERSGSGFGVSFPDFPGCVSAGDTLDAALFHAEEALAFHVEGLLEDDGALPAPSDLSAVPHDPEVTEVLRTMVHLDLPGQARAISVTLPEHLIQRIDRVGRNAGHSRSSFLAEGARRLLEEMNGRT